MRFTHRCVRKCTGSLMEIDFSQSHFLDHSIFSPECPKEYGGRKNHFHLWWEYQAKPEMFVRTTCKIGMHNFRPDLTFPECAPTGEYVCVYCHRFEPPI